MSPTVLVLAVASAAVPALVRAQHRVTTPKEHFGFDIGTDYRLATYTQFQSYWAILDRESDRMIVQDIGRTAEGRPQLMAIITSPENHRQLSRYKEIARRLALGEGISDAEAARLAAQGKAVVWIDGGLHATEVLGAHQLMELVYQLVSRSDPETMRILDRVVLLAVHANPDGMELVSSWYMREPDSLKRNSSNIPRLYQKYIGHDNNRDFYMVTQPETANMTRVLFHEWFPQVMYNHHQTGPAGTVMFAPPFRDPMNYYIDPMVRIGIDAFGAAMHGRFLAEGKGGTTMRHGANYSTWWNGGLRTVTYFHNMIGLLTETVGNPTPIDIPFLPERQITSGDLPQPVTPQRWHFRSSIDYSLTANRAVLDYAARHAETLLYNMYRMARNSIERGSRDHWTITPDDIQLVRDSLERHGIARRQGEAGSTGAPEIPPRYFALLHHPDRRDPRAYVLPAGQPDVPTAVKFVNALIKNGVTVHRATRDFAISGRSYGAGSYVVMTAQAFRPHVLDMFEPQDHPNDFEYAGGPPIPPYDNAGYTLAFQMGIEFDRVLDAFSAPLQPLERETRPPAGEVTGGAGAAGFLLSHRSNDAAIATNRLLAANHEVYWITSPLTIGDTSHPAGTIYIPARAGTRPLLETLAGELGISFEGVSSRPHANLLEIQPVRIGLWDRYGGSMRSGWTRWLLEQFEFPYEVVYPRALDRGDLARRFDVLVFPDGAIPRTTEPNRTISDTQSIPAECRARLGTVTAEKTVPQLRRFLDAGGTIITIGSSATLAEHLRLPVTDHLVEENGRSLPRANYYIPGSVLRVALDTTRPVAYGMPGQVDVFFDNSPVLRLANDAARRGVRRVGWFSTAAPLRSGWAWGQKYLKDGVVMAEVDVGHGTLFLFGPEILFRGQPHGTFKLFFNALHLARARNKNNR